MNSSLILNDPAESGLLTPNFVFIADQLQQQIVCSNLTTAHFPLCHEWHDTDLYGSHHQNHHQNHQRTHLPAHLQDSATTVLQSGNMREDLVVAMLQLNTSGQYYPLRFQDERGAWRSGSLQNVALYGGEGGQQEFLCGLISMARDSALRNSSDAALSSRLVWVTDANLRLSKVSGDCRTLGFDVATLLASGQLSFLTEETSDFLQVICEELLLQARAETRVMRQTVRSLDGDALSATIQFSLVFDADGNVTGTLGIAEFFPSRELLESERQLFAATFDAVSEGFFITDRSGFILRANPAFYELTGYAPRQILGLHCSQLWRERHGPNFFRNIRHSLQRDNKWRGECEFIRRSGELRPAILSFSQTRNLRHEVQYYVGMLMDMADKKRDEMRIYRLAHYDSLTGVANRLLFNERLQQEVEAAEQRQGAVAVLFLDLDRFKPVNDSLGHSAGDQLLKAASRRLEYCLGEQDMVARMGGDEFALILGNLAVDDDAVQLAKKMASKVLAQFLQPFLVEGRDVYSSTSIGISIFPEHGLNAEILLRSADTAMNAAKAAGKNNYQFYDEQMNRQAMDRLIMENAMRKALLRGEFELYYQPQYGVRNGVMTGIEVLLRWEHPVFGCLRPVEFIDLAEQTDLIIPLGEWVFQQTCEKIASWQQQGIRFPRVGINVSANQFKREDFADWVLHQVRHYRIDPAQLELEITESALMEDAESSLVTLRRLQQANIRIAVDDFGTGYSSLNYLRKFPLSTLKIDRVFIEDIVENDEARSLTQAVIAIAKSLKLGVIAEGVENWDQYRLLSDEGCDEVQGYYLSRALSESALLELMACELE